MTIHQFSGKELPLQEIGPNVQTQGISQESLNSSSNTNWYKTLQTDILRGSPTLLQYVNNLFRDREIGFGFAIAGRAKQADIVIRAISTHYQKNDLEALFSPGKILDLAYHDFQRLHGYEDPSTFQSNFFEKTCRRI